MRGKYLRLIHWNAAEAEERASTLRRAGYEVICTPFKGPVDLRALRNDPPLAMVIDLTRIPSSGRQIGLALRHHTTTRHVPLVFVGGDPEKVARTMKVLPDAVYATWRRIRSSLRHAIAHPPITPKVPASIFDEYADTPLVKKLGIAPHSVVILLDGPGDFGRTLGALPEGAVLRKGLQKGSQVIIWFNRTRGGLNRRIKSVKASLGNGRLWIAWPKKTSTPDSDLSQTVVRRIGLAAGLVDYKICSIDSEWSGLLFTKRRPTS